MQDIPEDLIIQAANGDMPAFEHIYNAFSGFVYNVAFRVSGNRENAEEITQDVFMKIYRNLGRFQFRSSFKTWIYRITANTAINLVKQRAGEESKKVEYNDAVQRKDAIGAAGRTGDEGRKRALLAALLGVLNPNQRACVVLRSVEGLSYEEIADTLKVNINTVRTRLKRAREKMLAHFKKRGDDK